MVNPPSFSWGSIITEQRDYVKMQAGDEKPTDRVLYNLRLKELVAVVRENERFYQDFIEFLREEGYASVLEFIQEPSDEKAAATISRYLSRPNEVKLYDGLLRPYPNSKAKWFFLAWLLRDAATQRLQPLLKTVPGETAVERKAHLLNEVRKFVGPLFPQAGSWEWPAISEVMLARLEGSRHALKGTLFEEIVRKNLRILVKKHGLRVRVEDKQVKIGDETYDVQVTGKTGSVLLPVKTRETMGGGHSLLFTSTLTTKFLHKKQGFWVEQQPLLQSSARSPTAAGGSLGSVRDLRPTENLGSGLSRLGERRAPLGDPA